MIEPLFADLCSHVSVPEATEEAMSYYRSGNVLFFIQQLWILIIPFLFLWWGFTGTLANYAHQWGKRWYLTIALYLVMFLALYQVLNFPIDFYSDYIREHAYSLSSQSFSRWFGNWGKSFLVSLISAVAFVWIFYLLIKKSPRRWWIYSSIASSVILFIMVFVQPIWVDPLFNQFGPMKDKKLEKQILDLACRAGIEHSRVYEVDMSQDTNGLNAYVVGFGSTSRIVLWDTTIKVMKPDEILFVMGHEMGHYVLHHIWWLLAYLTALSFVIFYLTYKAAHFLLSRYHKRFGFKQLHSIASFPLFLLLIGFFLLLFSPLTNYYSRCIEHEADRFGLEITQNNEAAAHAFIVLQQGNLGNPYPGFWYNFWCGTHPSLGERIEFCNSYCPWAKGKPLKYGDDFTDNSCAAEPIH
jgi:Zn-dependent protease with chaperone function